ncbi:transducin-like enhancer protein 1 isoform X1 [Apteryx rowi]|uniref:transducin-like enhancer protein 1 isoform X1 n=1 Tax=Apteryx rowi TaxID=308060 RepID=UPI000E1C7B7F|nr:transducin-like enhancer protein 1 isoform X1 [Apteryx rowi]
MFPQSRHPTPHQAAGQPFKFTIPESLDRIKEEFQFLQAQYHSLKLECEKLASEKTEMQRHYVMYYEMSYGLNIEMHKQQTADCEEANVSMGAFFGAKWIFYYFHKCFEESV